MTVAVLFGSHAGNSFEIAVKGCWLGEAEQVGWSILHSSRCLLHSDSRHLFWLYS